MADILSQDEVDALLSAIGEGASDTPAEEGASSVSVSSPKDSTAVKYNFRRPEIVSKDQIRTLQMLHKTFCRFLTTSLSGYLRTIVEVNFVAVDQLTYGEFAMSINHNPACINIFSMRPLEGRSVLEVDPMLVHSIIDRLLGGTGDLPTENKALTDIEQTIFTKVNDIFFQGLNEAWKTVLEFNMAWEQFETNPQFVQVVAPGETVILITCEIKIGPVSGILSICFPFVYLQPIIQSLSAQTWISSAQKKPSDEMKNSVKRSIEKTTIPVTAVLGTTQLTIRELLGLKVGDAMVMDQKVTDPAIVYLDNKPRFLGFAGIFGKQKAVRVSAFKKEYGMDKETKGEDKNARPKSK